MACSAKVAAAGAAATATPQPYAVERDDARGVLALHTPYYVVEHDLRQGGAIARIALRYGKAPSLLVRPAETRVRPERGGVLRDLEDAAPRVAHRRDGLVEIVEVECEMADADGRASGLRLRSTYEYHWGFVRIRREFIATPDGMRALEVTPFAAVLAPGLCEYGLREGVTEEEGAPPFAFGSNRWGRLRPGEPSDPPLETRFVPRSMIFVDPGVEGLEWFVGSDLAQWDLQLAGRRGQGRCALAPSAAPPGLALEVSAYRSGEESAVVRLPSPCVFEFYLAFPVRDGRAHPPWVHGSFNRNRGDWVAPDEIRRWAERGYQTVHCHNDGDYYDDGLFWRDGAYPPYPDMERYDQVLEECRRAGIRTATYFSNKELHPSTAEFVEHGTAWGRMNRAGALQHNFFRPGSEFGAQMCLRSGWSEFLKLSIDRVLSNHPLTGVYYDWNVALLCSNPRHEGKPADGGPGAGHWDIDELLDLMEWTRDRVGPDGLIIVHNTTTPMFATENFADYVVATEWGYGKWTDRAPDLKELPLEWSLAGARPRGVISYGTIESAAPRRLHRVFALEALLGGVTPWPASPETFELLPLLAPLGDIPSYRFADWRNGAVRLSDGRCAAAIYSKPEEAYLFLANLDAAAKEVTCALEPRLLPHPLVPPITAARVVASTAAAAAAAEAGAPELDVGRLIGAGVAVTIPPDGALLVRVR